MHLAELRRQRLHLVQRQGRLVATHLAVSFFGETFGDVFSAAAIRTFGQVHATARV